MADVSKQSFRKQVEEYIFNLQDTIVGAFETLDPTAPPFKRDSWLRPEGGQGRSCVFAVHPDSPAASAATPTILEKAGVNISIIHGTLPPRAIQQMRVDHASLPTPPEGSPGLPFYAAGLSLVIHPRNPHAPTVHSNYRYFEITEPPSSEQEQPKVLAWWFGGGADLTPSYLYEEDGVHFHKTLKNAIDPFGDFLYPAFKKWCDEYFRITHRDESRGIGGVFFDDLSDDVHPRIPGDGDQRARTPEGLFKFIRSVGDSFVPSYIPILERRAHTPSTERQRRWQLIRRGRYVEFNLVHDRGTKFGLFTPGARIESILMSLPETARWEYMSDLGTEEGSEEAELLKVLKTPREWV